METLVLFEDNPEKRKSYLALLKDVFSGAADIKAFANEDIEAGGSGMYEDDVKEYFQKQSDVVLVVADRDLTKIARGFSESAVSQVCKELLIPLCIYASGKTEPEPYSKITQDVGLKFNLVGTKTPNKMAMDIFHIFNGFKRINEKLHTMKSVDFKLGPASTLSRVLGQPEIQTKLGLYSISDLSGVADLYLHKYGVRLTGSGADVDADEKETIKRLKYMLGHWLYESVLEYPGVFLDETALYSYLNISKDDIKRPEVRNLFKSAFYTGPFSGIRDLWWRHILDKMMIESDCEDGKAFVKKMSSIEVDVCKCSSCKKSPAGFECIITKEALCSECSVSNLSWVPQGADLARVSREKFDELAPWLNL